MSATIFDNCTPPRCAKPAILCLFDAKHAALSRDLPVLFFCQFSFGVRLRVSDPCVALGSRAGEAVCVIMCLLGVCVAGAGGEGD